MVTDLLSTFIRLSYRQLGYLFFPWEQYWIRCFLLFFFFSLLFVPESNFSGRVILV